MNFKQWMNKTYYIAWTPHEYRIIVAISIKNIDEAVKLAVKAVPFNVQVISEQPMNYEQIMTFLDKLASWESKHKIIFLHGNNVDPRKFNTI